MKKKKFLLIMICLFTPSLNAAIIGGSVTIISPPLNTGNDNQQINSLLGFNELQYVTLVSDLVVDKPSGIIPAGTIISSHYIIFDPPGSSIAINGNVILDQKVIGVIYNTDTLNDSDYLGLSTTNYLNPSLRGFETSSGDAAEIAEPNKVFFHLTAGTPGDYARIITSSSYTNPGPRFVMRNPLAAVGGVHTNETGVGSVRLLFDEPLSFENTDITVTDENGKNVVAYATGSGSPVMVITFNEVLFANRYTITVHDTVVSTATAAAIDGDNNGQAGGDLVFTMEHRERHDSDDDNDIDLNDLAEFAEKWLWAE